MSHNAPLCGEALLRERLLDIIRNGKEHKKALDLVELSHNGTSIRAFQDFERFPNLSTETRRAQHADKLCLSFFSAALDPVNHLANMYSVCFQLIECHFPKALCADAAVNKSLEIIARLPSFPLRMRRLILHRLGDKTYLIDPDAEWLWENLKVAKFLNSTTLCLALAIASTILIRVENQEPSLGPLPSLPDTLIELLDTAGSLSASAKSPEEVQAWLVVHAFLWATWQRCTMLILWYILGSQLEQGFNGFQRESYSMRQFKGGQQFEDLNDFPDMPRYMCKWAFRLMRSDRSALTLDFRRFFYAFSETFPNQEPRCVLDPHKGPQQCDGSSVDHCQRFKGMKTIDQSAHAPLCGLEGETCRPLHWNEESYKSVQGARAVALEEQLPDNLLRYCPTSTTTLAVSHVWSHGQGGRPETYETGLNSCLHRRYCRIARDYGCTSYWLDTPCIPHERQLREHAISQINRIFAQSRITLICDRDLMNIAVTDAPLSINTSEKIISTLLVCDWNVRAWTLLESMRGRKHIYVLCKNDAIVSVREVLEIVYSKGCIDIAILTLTSQHLVPWQMVDEDSEKEMDVIDIPESSAILSHRHASRPGDDIVIWSLMVSTEPFFTAKDFWEPKRGILRSGYLMSDLPRLHGVPGRSWAPSRPRLAGCVWTHDPFSFELKQHSGRVYDGIGSTWGIITDSGLRTTWHTHEHTQGRGASLGSNAMGALDIKRILGDIVQQYNIQERLVILAYPGPHGPMQNEDNRTIYVGHLGGPLYAVISSEDETVWKWIGLYEWPPNVEAPVFKSKMLTLV